MAHGFSCSNRSASQRSRRLLRLTSPAVVGPSSASAVISTTTTTTTTTVTKGVVVSSGRSDSQRRRHANVSPIPTSSTHSQGGPGRKNGRICVKLGVVAGRQVHLASPSTQNTAVKAVKIRARSLERSSCPVPRQSSSSAARATTTAVQRTPTFVLQPTSSMVRHPCVTRRASHVDGNCPVSIQRKALRNQRIASRVEALQSSSQEPSIISQARERLDQRFREAALQSQRRTPPSQHLIGCRAYRGHRGRSPPFEQSSTARIPNPRASAVLHRTAQQPPMDTSADEIPIAEMFSRLTVDVNPGRHGLQAEEIRKLPTEMAATLSPSAPPAKLGLFGSLFSKKAPASSARVDEALDCSVCLEDFAGGQTLMRLECGHKFHDSCIKPWLLTHAQCPYCRKDVKVAGSAQN